MVAKLLGNYVWKMEEREGNGRRRGGKGEEGKREVKERRIGRGKENGKKKGIRNEELKNVRLGKEIKLVATLYTP